MIVLVIVTSLFAQLPTQVFIQLRVLDTFMCNAKNQVQKSITYTQIDDFCVTVKSNGDIYTEVRRNRNTKLDIDQVCQEIIKRSIFGYINEA